MTERTAGSRRRNASRGDPLEAILPLLYETALATDASHWSRVLDLIAETFDAQGAGILTSDKLVGQALLFQMTGIPKALLERYEYRASEDVLYHASLKDRSDTAIIGRASVSPEEHMRSRFYRELLAPSGLHWFLGGRFESTALIFSAVGIFRSRRRADFDERDAALLRELIPHLKAAVRVARRLAQAEGATRASIATLQFSRHGVALLDANGRVLFLNDEARRIAASRDGISYRGDRLRLRDENANRRLQDLLDDVGRRTARRRRAEGGRLRVPRLSGQLPYELVAVDIADRTSSHRYFPAGSAIQLLISDPVEVFNVNRRLLVDTYGLSVNQARLCQGLLRAGSLEEAARQMGITPHSARTHLRRAFAKLGVSSQMELVLLLGSTIRTSEGAGPGAAPGTPAQS